MTANRSPRRRVLRAALVLVAASMLLATPQASGQEGSGLGGYQGTAAASGLKAFYFLQGVLPIGPLVELGVPDAYATISTGPATFARASVADPGDVIANPNALLGNLDPNAPRVPEYPFRVSATSGFGEPEAQSSPAPGLDARVKVAADSAVAEATTPKFEAPAIVKLGSLRSQATTTTDGSTVTVNARTEIGSFELLGLVTIESIVTDVTATSDGTTTTTEGGTTITGASVLGQPIIIDADGIHTDPDAPNENPLITAVSDLLGIGGGNALDPVEILDNAGLQITVAGPRELEGGGAAQLAAGGLRVDLLASDETVPLLNQLIEALPPIESPIPGAPGIEDVLAVLQANQFVALELGGASVSLEARAAFVPEPFTPAPIDTATPPTPAPSTGSGVAPSAPTATPSLTPSVPTAAPSAPETVPTSGTSVPPVSLSAGIGVLALIALLFQPLIGDRLAQAAAAILGSDDPGTCPREGQ